MSKAAWEDEQLVDIHTHVLPSVDDGADDWQAALAMLRIAEDDGIGALACTPHQSSMGEIVNRNADVTSLVQQLQERASEAGLGIRLYSGGEVRCTLDVIERMDKGEAATYGVVGEPPTREDTDATGRCRYMLLEMPFAHIPPFTHQVIFELLVRGITPVIAHPERNEEFTRKPELLAQLVQAGALAQITAASLSRLAHAQLRETCALFISHNLVHFIASDAHSSHKRPPVMRRYVNRVASIWGADKALSLASRAPGALLRGEVVAKEAPLEFSRASRREAIMAARALATGSSRRSAFRWFGLPGAR